MGVVTRALTKRHFAARAAVVAAGLSVFAASCTSGSLDRLRTAAPDGGDATAGGAGGAAGASGGGAAGAAGTAGAVGVDAGPDACADAAAGVPCGAGVFVSNKIGKAGAAGTMADPLDTIEHGIAKAQALGTGSPTTVYVADGQYAEKVTLVEGIGLRGGYSCESTSDCTWKRDPAKYQSVIVDQDDEGVLAPADITRKTLIDGFHIQGRIATSPRGTALTIAGGSPTVSNNTIEGMSSNTSNASSGGVVVESSSSGAPIAPPGPLIEGNTITSGQAPLVSIGIALTAPLGSTATPPPATVAEISNNTIYGGNATSSYGIYATTSADGTKVVGNVIGAGSASNESWGIWFSSALEIDSNRINADAQHVTRCSLANWCGGISSSSGKTVVTNNIVYGANASHSAAMEIAQRGTPAQEVVVSSNYLVGAPPAASNAVPATAAVVLLDDPGCKGCAAVTVGRIRNNFIMPGHAATRFGVEEVAGQADIHPDKLENNDLWFAPYALNSTKDVVYQQMTAGATSDLALAGVNALSFASGNFQAACYDSTYHLIPGSKCIDGGVSADAPDHDIFGDKRPSQSGKYDVGPDEAQP